MKNPVQIYDDLADAVDALSFSNPVACVYNPLRYAKNAMIQYLERYDSAYKEAVFLGMNPGPWGMVQTGIPFGDVPMVRDWIGIDVPTAVPEIQHPKRPIEGFQCRRREVSGKRFWGLMQAIYGTPEVFFSNNIVLNYCPLAFMEAGGKNITPDKLPIQERNALLTVCDNALVELLSYYQPKYLIGIGNFALKRLELICTDNLEISRKVEICKIPHPSPASPAANQDWAGQTRNKLCEIGITLPDGS